MLIRTDITEAAMELGSEVTYLCTLIKTLLFSHVNVFINPFWQKLSLLVTEAYKHAYAKSVVAVKQSQ